HDLAGAFLGGDFIKAGVAYEYAVRPLDDPDVIGDRCHLVMRIAEDVVLGSLARVRRVTDCVDLMDVVAHDFLPIMMPARLSIILTMAVKSLSPPNSALVASHCSRTELITEFGAPRPFASSTHSRTSLSISAVAKP